MLFLQLLIMNINEIEFIDSSEFYFIYHLFLNKFPLTILINYVHTLSKSNVKPCSNLNNIIMAGKRSNQNSLNYITCSRCANPGTTLIRSLIQNFSSRIYATHQRRSFHDRPLFHQIDFSIVQGLHIYSEWLW